MHFNIVSDCYRCNILFVNCKIFSTTLLGSSGKHDQIRTPITSCYVRCSFTKQVVLKAVGSDTVCKNCIGFWIYFFLNQLLV